MKYMPFLVRFRSSPPLETKSNAEFDSFPSHFSSAKAKVVPPYSLCSLTLSVAAPRKAAIHCSMTAV